MQCQAFKWLKARIKSAPLGAALMLLSALAPSALWAAEFSVSPIRLQFEPGTRSGVLAVRNSDKRPIRFQLSLVEWTQNENGIDVYKPSDDLIFFPRQFSVPVGDKLITRVGPKSSPSGSEKAYRLRIEELAEVDPNATQSAINLTITFAVPIFVGKPDAKPQAVIAPLRLQDGKLRATVQNTGHSQFRIDTLELTGVDGYSEKMGGWYLLAGASRSHDLQIAPEVCRAQKRLNLTLKVGDSSFVSALDVDPSMCGS
jgi:fimbrial chaperone protein